MKGARVQLTRFEAESLKAASAMIDKLRVEERGAIAGLAIGSRSLRAMVRNMQPSDARTCVEASARWLDVISDGLKAGASLDEIDEMLAARSV